MISRAHTRMLLVRPHFRPRTIHTCHSFKSRTTRTSSISPPYTEIPHTTRTRRLSDSHCCRARCHALRNCDYIPLYRRQRRCRNRQHSRTGNPRGRSTPSYSDSISRRDSRPGDRRIRIIRSHSPNSPLIRTASTIEYPTGSTFVRNTTLSILRTCAGAESVLASGSAVYRSGSAPSVLGVAVPEVTS